MIWYEFWLIFNFQDYGLECSNYAPTKRNSPLGCHALLISSVVNKVGLLTTERMELFSCVDCAWYKSDAGSDFHRPMDMIFVGDTWAARAIVGADMRNECVSNHVASRPNTVAACFTANCMSLYNKHFNCPFARYDKKGSEPSRCECRAH